MDFSDLNKEIKATLYDRIGDPFIGSFIFFFVTWNWRFFYTLVRPGEVSTESTISSAINYINCYSFALPAFFTIFYVFGYSWLRKWIISFWYNRQTASANAKRLAEKRKLLTEEEGRHLQSLADEEGRKLTAIINQQSQEISSFKDFIVYFAKQAVTPGRGGVNIGLFQSYSATSRDGVYALNENNGRLSIVPLATNSIPKLVYVFDRIGMGSYVLGAHQGSLLPLPAIMREDPNVTILKFLRTGELLSEAQVIEKYGLEKRIISYAEITKIDPMTARFERITT